MSSNDSITFKLRHGDDVRRFALRLPETGGLGFLCAHVANVLHQSAAVTLRYTDDEGDLVTMAGDADLAEAVAAGQPVRLELAPFAVAVAAELLPPPAYREDDFVVLSREEASSSSDSDLSSESDSEQEQPSEGPRHLAADFTFPLDMAKAQAKGITASEAQVNEVLRALQAHPAQVFEAGFGDESRVPAEFLDNMRRGMGGRGGRGGRGMGGRGFGARGGRGGRGRHHGGRHHGGPHGHGPPHGGPHGHGPPHGGPHGHGPPHGGPHGHGPPHGGPHGHGPPHGGPHGYGPPHGGPRGGPQPWHPAQDGPTPWGPPEGGEGGAAGAWGPPDDVEEAPVQRRGRGGWFASGTRGMSRLMPADDTHLRVLEAGTTAEWTWTVRNDHGSKAWPEGVQIAPGVSQPIDSRAFGAPGVQLAPGETTELRVTFTVPDRVGLHWGFWRLTMPGSERRFGDRLPALFEVVAPGTDVDGGSEVLRRLAAAGYPDAATNVRLLHRKKGAVSAVIVELASLESKRERLQQREARRAARASSKAAKAAKYAAKSAKKGAKRQ